MRVHNRNAVRTITRTDTAKSTQDSDLADLEVKLQTYFLKLLGARVHLTTTQLFVGALLNPMNQIPNTATPYVS